MWRPSRTQPRLGHDALGLLEANGLPTPVTNTSVHGYEADQYFPDEQVIVELDSWKYHQLRSSFESDRERDATMLFHRIVTIRITDPRLEKSPDREAERLHAILRWRREDRR